MSSTTTATNNNAAATKKAQVIAQALKLRDVRKKHAAQVARFAGILQLATKGLMDIEAQIRTEAIAIAGSDYDIDHTITFEPYGSIETQLENIGEVRGPGLEDIDAFAEDLLYIVNPILSADEALPLPSERTN